MITPDPRGNKKALTGEWTVLPYSSQIEAVHMCLLPTGKVLYYSGFRIAEAIETETRLWSPKLGEIKKPHTPADIFCAGHCALPDGRLLSTGGSLEYRGLPPIPAWLVSVTKPVTPLLVRLFRRFYTEPSFTGPTFCYVFNPWTEQWEFAGDMQEGRWYPTNTALPDGRVLILSGTNEGGGFGSKGRIDINLRVETFDIKNGIQQVATVPTVVPSPVEPPTEPPTEPPYDPSGNAPGGSHRNLHLSPQDAINSIRAQRDEGERLHSEDWFTVYPRMVVLPIAERERMQHPAGRVFCAGYGPPTMMLDLATWEWTHVSDLNYGQRYDGCAVLLPLRPPGYRARILSFGGSTTKYHEPGATETAELIDFGDPEPKWRTITPLKDRRTNACAVLLPDGRVLVVGGNSHSQFNQPVLRVELFDPETEMWFEVAPMRIPRGYHSTALLLPDGRVLSVGTTPYGHHELRMEVYSPYYLFRGPRPVIKNVPFTLDYNAMFEIAFTPNMRIGSVVLMRPGATTHAFDMDQRLVELSFVPSGPGRLTAQAPRDEHVAPPGYYMLFILSDEGVPSEAVFVHLPIRR